MNSKSGTLTMEKEGQAYILLAGTMGVILALLTTPPKKIKDAVIASIAGACGCLIVSPFVAEIVTNIGKHFGWSWLDASPETNAYAMLIWLGGMLGFQLVIVINNNFVNWIQGFTSHGIAGFIAAVVDWIKSFPIKSKDDEK